VAEQNVLGGPDSIQLDYPALIVEGGGLYFAVACLYTAEWFYVSL